MGILRSFLHQNAENRESGNGPLFGLILATECSMMGLGGPDEREGALFLLQPRMLRRKIVAAGEHFPKRRATEVLLKLHVPLLARLRENH
jgi:hypothetical protein